jgi:hypothetical protein
MNEILIEPKQERENLTKNFSKVFMILQVNCAYPFSKPFPEYENLSERLLQLTANRSL